MPWRCVKFGCSQESADFPCQGFCFLSQFRHEFSGDHTAGIRLHSSVLRSIGKDIDIAVLDQISVHSQPMQDFVEFSGVVAHLGDDEFATGFDLLLQFRILRHELGFQLFEGEHRRPQEIGGGKYHLLAHYLMLNPRFIVSINRTMLTGSMSKTGLGLPSKSLL